MTSDHWIGARVTLSRPIRQWDKERKQSGGHTLYHTGTKCTVLDCHDADERVKITGLPSRQHHIFYRLQFDDGGYHPSVWGGFIVFPSVLTLLAKQAD